MGGLSTNFQAYFAKPSINVAVLDIMRDDCWTALGCIFVYLSGCCYFRTGMLVD